MNNIKKTSLTLAVAAVAIVLCMTAVPMEQSDAAEPLNGNITYSSEYGLDIMFNDYSEIQGSSVIVTFGTTSFRGATIGADGIAHFEPSDSMLKTGSNIVGVTVVYPDMSGLEDYISTSTIVNIEFEINEGAGADLETVQVSDGYELLVEDTGWIKGDEKFVGWATSASSQSYTPIGETITIDDNASHSVTLYAIYGSGEEPVPENHTVSFEQPANGSLTVTYDGKEIQSGAEVPEGAGIVVTATANEGYEFESLKVNGVDFENGGTYTVSADVTIVATFKETTIDPDPEPEMYIVTIDDVDHVTITVKAGDVVITSGTEVEDGTVLTVTYEVEKGYKLVSSSGTTVTVEGGNVSITATVEPVPVTGIQIDKPTLSLKVGGTETISATVTPEGALDATVTWSSSDENVVTVDHNGNVTAVGVGDAIITVSANDGSGIRTRFNASGETSITFVPCANRRFWSKNCCVWK